VLKEWFLETTVTTAEISARLGINIAHPWCKPLSVTTIFRPYSLDINGLQLNHTHNMSLSDLKLQYDQASAVLPIIQQKYSNIALFNSPHALGLNDL
jgi:hypothetical protein